MERIILLNDIGIYDQVIPTRYIGPYVLASTLEDKGYDVIVIDWFTRLDEPISYIEQFITENTIYIGVSSTLLSLPIGHFDRGKMLRTYRASNYNQGYLWLPTEHEMMEWSKALKEKLNAINPNGKLIVGGAKTAQIYNNRRSKSIQEAYKYFDLICLGLADKAIEDITECFSLDLYLKVENEGLLTFYRGETLGEISCPSMNWNDKHVIQYEESLPLEVARGCAFNCKFCNYEKKTVNVKNLDILRDELIKNYEEYGTKFYNICDDCFNDNKIKVNNLCEMFLELPFKIEWITYARIDLAVKFPETFDIMVQSGLKGVCFGIETLNHKAGRAAGKGVPPEKVKKTLLELYQKYSDQMFFQCSFISGLPYETTESTLDTIEWFKNNRSFDFASIGVLGIPHYNPDDDNNFIDYSDYSRNPEKYGFNQISFDPYYWKHDTMDIHEATRLANLWNNEMNNQNDTAVMSIWAYPSLRAMGFSLNEIKDMMRNQVNKKIWSSIISLKSEQYLTKYFNDLYDKEIHRN